MRDDRIHPKKVAEAIREDDLRIMQTRRPMVDRVEALFARTRTNEWFLTTKLPILAPGGEVIGVMGFVRPCQAGPDKKLRDSPIRRVIAHVQKHHRSRIPIATLVELSRLSQRQLNRKFHETFQMSVQQFIMKTRVQEASKDLLGSSKSIGEIAFDHGFYDQSFFTRYFKQHLGETPLTYRRRRRIMEET